MNSKEYKQKLLQFNSWRISGELAKYETGESVLLKYGVASVREIVAVLRRDGLNKERKDCLAMLAASVLWKMALRKERNGEPMDEECRLLAISLAEYVDKMDDPGVFSYRYYAVHDLNSFFKIAKMPKSHFIPGRQERQNEHVVTNSSPSVGRGQ